MSLTTNFSLYNNYQIPKQIGFKSDVKNNKQIKESDILITKLEEEKNKKSTKKALTAGGIVLTIGLFITLLNPKNSTKILKYLNKLQEKNKNFYNNSKNNFLKTKFGKFIDKTINLTSRCIRATGNYNNGKDILYKDICSKKRQYKNVKNENFRKFLVKINDIFTNVMTYINKKITKGFDFISQKTVRNKYKNAIKSLDKFEINLKQIKEKLPENEKKLLDEKLAEIAKNKKYFEDSNLTKRFEIQEKGMNDLNLEEQVKKKIKDFFNGYKDKRNVGGLINHTDKNLTLWSEDILKPTKEKLEKEGNEAVQKLFGKDGKKGLYDELMDLTEKYINPEDKKSLLKKYKTSAKKLFKANKSECFDYYDKKRDLVLGGAPTDILTGCLGIGLGSLALIKADTKEERKAKLFGSTAFPLIPTFLGICSSIAMTAMLYSGGTGLLVGAGVTITLSKLGSMFNKYVLGYDEDAIHEAKLKAKQEKKEQALAERKNKQNINNTKELANV